MRFHTLLHAPIRPGDLVYRESSLHKLIGLLLALVISPLFFAFYQKGLGRNDGFWLFVLALGAILTLFYICWIGHALLRTLDSQNWGVRARPGGLLIKFRSYKHTHLPQDRRVIVELEPAEIDWLRIKHVSQTIGRHRHAGRPRHRHSYTYLEIKPAGVDLSQFKTLLQEEQQLRPAGFNKDESPVHIGAEGGLIRVLWRDSGSTFLTPTETRAAEQISKILNVPVRHDNDATPAPLTAADKTREQENRILELAECGDAIGAVKLAQKVYGFSLAQAHRFVEELLGKDRTPLS